MVNISNPQTKKKLCSKLRLRKLFESLYIFLTISGQVEKYFAIIMHSNSSDSCVYYYNVQILNFFDPEVQMITKPMIKNKLNELLSKLK